MKASLSGPALSSEAKFESAAEHYQKAVAIKDVPSYHAGMADAYARARKTDDAVREYQLAAAGSPASAAQYWYNIAAVYTNAGKIDEANAACDKAIAADPNYAEAYYLKGTNLLGKATLNGNKMVAPPGTEDALKKYLELKPDGPNAEAAKALLASLGATVETTYGKKGASGKKK